MQKINNIKTLKSKKGKERSYFEGKISDIEINTPSMTLRLDNKQFYMVFGKDGWIKGMKNVDSNEMSKYKCLVITNKGIYLNAEKIAKGKLELIKHANI
jgi:hypothetical protein